MFRFTIDESDLTHLNYFLMHLYNASTENDVMVAGVRAIGMHNSEQFASRGTYFGRKWQNISRTTEAIRELRGHAVLAPPLEGSGWLKLAVTSNLYGMPWANSVWTTHDKPYRGASNDGPSVLTTTITTHQATVTMKGPKASHMTGEDSVAKRSLGYGAYGSMMLPKRQRPSANRYGMGYMPPRPFWGLRREVLEDAATLMMNRLFLNWANFDTRTTWYKPSRPEHMDVI